MKRILLIFISILIVGNVFGQEEIFVSGYIYESNTEKPIPFVNIGFLNEKVGTVTDEYGRFDLYYDLDKISPNSILQISSLGYKTIKMNATEFYTSLGENDKIFMSPQPFDLNEVVIKNEKSKQRNIGFSRVDDNTIGYWLNAEALGGEIAMKLPVDKEKTKLHELSFYINRNNSRVFRLRVNIYDYSNGMPGKNLLKENIFHEVSNKFGMETINLEPYDIMVDDDIVVSLELVKVYGDYIDFEIAGSTYNSHSFTRNLSQDKWERYTNKGIAIKLSTSYPSPSGKIIAKKRIEPKRISIYWDASESMASQDRDLKTELKLLERFIKKLNDIDVEIITFNTQIIDRHKFIIRKGITDGLIDYLDNTYYHSEAVFDSILKTNEFNAESFLLFTDGQSVFEPLEQTIYVPTFAINSKKDASHLKLQEVSSYGDGHYINLLNVSLNEGLEMLLTEQNDNVDYQTNESRSDFITGRIVSDSLTVPFATVRVKYTYDEVLSDSEGNFKIDAELGDILAVDGLGLHPIEYTVKSKKDNTINLSPKGDVLEEVTVMAEKRDNEPLIQTPYGIKNFNSITYDYSELTSENISDGIQTYDQVFAKLPGVIVTGKGFSKRYSLLRSMGSSGEMDTNPIIVIDDMVYVQENGLENLPPINFETIKNIKVLKSLASTNRYGSLGAYGAIEIRTESTALPDRQKKKPKNDLLVQNNDYVSENIQSLMDVSLKSSLLKEIESSNTLEDSKNKYLSITENNTINSIDFYVDAFEHFKEQDKEFAISILSNLAVKAKTNTKALRILAYKLEEIKENKKAKYVFELIKKLQPDQAQTYYDLAKNYEQIGMYQESLELYKLMLANKIDNIDFSNLNTMLANDLIRLVYFYKSKLDLTGIPDDYLSYKPNIDMRIVFSWNDPKEEFEVQFVNPQNKYFVWSNTLFENKEELFDQVLNGYSIKEFVIDDSDSGEWLINMETLNKSENYTPTYLKYGIYENFGQPNETYKVKVVKLDTYQQKILLEKIHYN